MVVGSSPTGSIGVSVTLFRSLFMALCKLILAMVLCVADTAPPPPFPPLPPNGPPPPQNNTKENYDEDYVSYNQAVIAANKNKEPGVNSYFQANEILITITADMDKLINKVDRDTIEMMVAAANAEIADGQIHNVKGMKCREDGKIWMESAAAEAVAGYWDNACDYVFYAMMLEITNQAYWNIYSQRNASAVSLMYDARSKMDQLLNNQ